MIRLPTAPIREGDIETKSRFYRAGVTGYQKDAA
jgi:hypothetical protein